MQPPEPTARGSTECTTCHFVEKTGEQDDDEHNAANITLPADVVGSLCGWGYEAARREA